MASKREQQRADKVLLKGITAYRAQVMASGVLIKSAEQLSDEPWYAFPVNAEERENYLDIENQFSICVILARAKNIENDHIFPAGVIRDSAVKILLRKIDPDILQVISNEILDAYGERLAMIRRAIEGNLSVTPEEQAIYDAAEAEDDASKSADSGEEVDEAPIDEYENEGVEQSAVAHDGSAVAVTPDVDLAMGNSVPPQD